MALAPTAAAPPVDEPAMGMEGEGGGPTVLCTILKNSDGTYMLVQGDEPEGMHGGEEMGEGEPAEPQGETYDSIGQLLKGVLDIVQTDADGGESGADQMRAGYQNAPGA